MIYEYIYPFAILGFVLSGLILLSILLFFHLSNVRHLWHLFKVIFNALLDKIFYSELDFIFGKRIRRRR
jgi:hypothetical protein